MTETSRIPTKPTRRVGRPALVDREQIAQAASEISLSDLTMRAVADRLGVSVTSLYYYVRDSEELRNLAAERVVAKHPVPVANGQHWAEWLYQWAEHSRAAFVAEPGLFEHFLAGTLNLGNVLANIDKVIGFMKEQGFSPAEAMDAYALVSSCAVGAAVAEIRAAHLLLDGRSWDEVAAQATGGSKRLKHLARIGNRALPTFRDQICTLIVGIAVRRGDQASEILEVLGAR